MRFLLLTVLSAGWAAGQAEETLDSWRLHRVVAIEKDLHHVQGIDIEGDVLWISSVDAKAGKGYLTRVSLPDGRVTAQVEVQEGKRIHPGGMALDGDSVWIPVAEYDRDGPTTMQRRDKKTLALSGRFEVNDHIGCVAAGKAGLIGGSWGSRTVYGWSREGSERWRKANPQQTAWQDLKMDGDRLVGSGNFSKDAGAVEFLSVPDLRLVRRIVVGKTDRGLPYTHEGMALGDGKLFFLPEDAPTRLFEFRKRP